jgi:hypothetical protein
MHKWVLALAALVLYLLHQDVWLWRTSRPFFFGFLPAGLFYHAAYCLACAALMWALVKFAWPHALDEAEMHRQPETGNRQPR